MEEKIIREMEVTNDLVFQRIFGKVGNEEITKGFLESILDIQIDELTLDTNKRLIGEKVDDKIGRVDVKAKLKDGTKVIIEMQVKSFSYMPERELYYWAQTYTEGFKRTGNYDELKKTISILISKENLRITKGIEKYHTIWELREKDNTDKKYTNAIEMHVIELSKYKEGEENKEKGEWIKFIKEGAKIKMNKDVNKALQEAMEELERLTASDEMQEMYYQRIKDLRDMISAISEGKREGYEAGGKEKEKYIVLNMHKEKMNIDTICKITNLTKEEVEKIIKEN